MFLTYNLSIESSLGYCSLCTAAAYCYKRCGISFQREKWCAILTPLDQESSQILEFWKNITNISNGFSACFSSKWHFQHSQTVAVRRQKVHKQGFFECFAALAIWVPRCTHFYLCWDSISMIQPDNCIRKSYKGEKVSHKIIVLRRKKSRTITLPQVVTYRSDGKNKAFLLFLTNHKCPVKENTTFFSVFPLLVKVFSIKETLLIEKPNFLFRRHKRKSKAFSTYLKFYLQRAKYSVLNILWD